MLLYKVPIILTLGPKETSLKTHSMVKSRVKRRLKLDRMSCISGEMPWYWN